MALWPQVFLAMGSDNFRLLEFIQSMKLASAQKYGDFAVQSFSYPEDSLSTLRSEFFTPAFLSEKRVLFCTGLPWSASDKISDTEKELLLLFLDSLSSLPEDIVIFFISPVPDKRTKFFKTVSSSVQKIHEFAQWDKESEKNKYIEWIMAKSIILGTQCSKSIAEFLLLYVGYSLSSLYVELEKLSMRRFGQDIQKQDIIDLCVMNEENADFAFSNAFSTADITKVMAELSTLFDSSSAPEVFNRDIISSFRNLLKAHLTQQMKEDFGLHPFVLKKMMPLLKKIPSDTVLQTIEFLKDLDIGTKTGKYSLSPDARAFILQIETMFTKILL